MSDRMDRMLQTSKSSTEPFHMHKIQTGERGEREKLKLVTKHASAS